jgi:hypothetical protein
VSFHGSEVSTHKEWVHLLLNFRVRVEFFNFRFSAKRVNSVSGDWPLDFPQLLS